MYRRHDAAARLEREGTHVLPHLPAQRVDLAARRAQHDLQLAIAVDVSD